MTILLLRYLRPLRLVVRTVPYWNLQSEKHPIQFTDCECVCQSRYYFFYSGGQWEGEWAEIKWWKERRTSCTSAELRAWNFGFVSRFTFVLINSGSGSRNLHAPGRRRMKVWSIRALCSSRNERYRESEREQFTDRHLSSSFHLVS